MNDLLKGTILFVGGMIALNALRAYSVGTGEVVYENDDMYVRAAKDKSHGYSWAEVHYKRIPDEEK